MNLEESLKKSLYFRENIDILDIHEGIIELPTWQFALLIDKFEELRKNMVMWVFLFIIMFFAVVWFGLVL